MSKALRFLQITAEPHDIFSFSYRISNGKNFMPNISIKLLQILLTLCKHRKTVLPKRAHVNDFVRFPAPKIFNIAEVK